MKLAPVDVLGRRLRKGDWARLIALPSDLSKEPSPRAARLPTCLRPHVPDRKFRTLRICGARSDEEGGGSRIHLRWTELASAHQNAPCKGRRL